MYVKLKYMKRLKAFLYVYKNSLTSLAYYKELLTVKPIFSFKYFFALTLLATLITTVRIGVPAMPELKNFSQTLLRESSEIFPNDLVLTSKDGEWYVNQPEPFSIKAPQFMKTAPQEAPDVKFPENLITFYHDGTINDLETLDTLMLVNNVNFIVRSEQGKIEAHKLTDLQDGTFDRQSFDKILGVIERVTAYIPLFVYTILLLAAFAYFFVYRLWYLVVIAAALMLLGYFKKLNFTFGTYYKLGLHAFTLPLTIEVLLILFGGRIEFPMWELILNLVFGFLVLTKIESSTQPKPAEQK